MKSLFFVGLMLFVSLFVAACSGQSEEVVGNGKDKDTVAVVADSQIVSLPCPWKETVDVDADSLASWEFVQGIEGFIAMKPCCLRFIEHTYQRGAKKQYFAGFLDKKMVYRTEVRDTTLSLDNGFKIVIKNGILKLYLDDDLCCTRSFNGKLKMSKNMVLARITR